MAKAKDKSIEEKLRELYTLQTIDSQLDEIEILKGELPMEVSDLEDEIAGLDKRIDRLTGVKDELNDEILKHTANIQEAESLIERYNKQLDDVKNNREYDALTKELELQKLEIELSEKRQKDLAVKVDSNNELLESSTIRKDKKVEQLSVKKDELQDIIAKTEKQEETLKKKSTSQRKKIEPRLLMGYDRVRGNYRNGLGVVTVSRDACGGCFNKIPPQTQLEINLMKRIVACEHCGRILIDNQIAGQ